MLIVQWEIMNTRFYEILPIQKIWMGALRSNDDAVKFLSISPCISLDYLFDLLNLLQKWMIDDTKQ